MEGSEKESKKVHTTDTAQKEDISQETNIACCFINNLFEIEYGGNSLYIDGYS